MKRAVGLICLLVGLTLATQVSALTGVGALADRVSPGAEITLRGKTAPWAEVVIVEENDDRVVVAAEVESSGIFEFKFRITEEGIGVLVLFGVDDLGMTSRIRVEEMLGLDVLLPPTIVNDESDLSLTAAALTGMSYPGSTVDLRLINELFQVQEFELLVDANGYWKFFNDDLPPGKYTGIARSRFSGLVSADSQEIYFEIPLIEIPRFIQEGLDLFETIVPGAEVIQKAAEPVAQLAVPVLLLTQFWWLLKDLIFWLIQLLYGLLRLFGWRKGARNWGVVYDAKTKQPLPRAIVRLYEVVGKVATLVETDVTGNDGVFSFLPKNGKYVIKVVKPGYIFPSKIVPGRTGDGEYERIYHGEELMIMDDEPVSVSIPMDPAQGRITYWFKVRQSLRRLMTVLSPILMVVAIVMATLAVIQNANRLNLAVLALDIGILIFDMVRWRRLRRGYGEVKEVISGKGIEGVGVALRDTDFGRLVQRRVTDEKGRFQMVVPGGTYRLDVVGAGYVMDIKTRKDGYKGQVIRLEGKKSRVLVIKVYVRKR